MRHASSVLTNIPRPLCLPSRASPIFVVVGDRRRVSVRSTRRDVGSLLRVWRCRHSAPRSRCREVHRVVAQGFARVNPWRGAERVSRFPHAEVLFHGSAAAEDFLAQAILGALLLCPVSIRKDVMSWESILLLVRIKSVSGETEACHHHPGTR